MRLLDLFCGAGGAAMGYSRAGFDEIVGVDIKPQPHYPFEFIQADWEEVVSTLPGLWERNGEEYAVHASPPCQRFSTMTGKWGRQNEHPDLIEPVQMALRELGFDGVPYVIENVPGAPLDDPVMLCGSMFGLGSQGYQLQRHRIFESNRFFFPPASCAHVGQPLPVYGHAGGRSKRDGLKFPGTDAWREGMGISWMTGKELAEAIPPAFTEYIGRQILEAR
jgi:DNA (cytosine-5)-methyltransferase 1